MEETPPPPLQAAMLGERARDFAIPFAAVGRESLCAVVERLRTDLYRGEMGVVGANGGILTEHSVGVYFHDDGCCSGCTCENGCRYGYGDVEPQYSHGYNPYG